MGVAKKIEAIEERKFIKDDMEIIDLFRLFAKTKEKLWVWQQKKDENGFRPVHFAIIKKFDPLKKMIYFVPNNSRGFRLREKEEMYLFSQSRNIACKVTARELGSDFLIISTPLHLNILSEELASKLSIVEKENEESHLTERTAPRKTANDGQLVSIERVEKDGTLSPAQMYGLYDISKGGMGFRANDPAEFLQNDKIFVSAVDGKPLPQKLSGTVVAIRQMEEEFETFKIGVKFNKD